ncbi:biotin/lipoyl-containing protein [Tetragenococcus halophilus]|uniref:Na(+)-transporting decarboxylase biotin carrier protein n=1 Tax=Tetragenococcus halophilus (strain DSM 20338 / JCM 20259 / NCIMB 9735 / NBRC 12172) TaxID=945021 RepID=A0AAN1SGJ2_TETHN|nr:biotin/lipoyl-containing protein [Tetragenococcus halophilus]BAK94116.1 Na(+)-transporting decarboxylase biotin carrier protein [Tetragenococcus halophilus NBRC 12172]GBD71362.1 na(+)-transporting decarboxylase biotin carrier protein [Tetragenococcus halophilus subsp. halophilus]
MNNYEVEIDGKLYRVTIEEISENERSEPKEAVQTQSQPQQSQEQTQASPAPTATSGGESVTAPMPGNIYKVQTKAGQAVKEGETVIVLEAMKMENEIVAPADGTISAINVTEGQAVEADDVLFEL